MNSNNSLQKKAEFTLGILFGLIFFRMAIFFPSGRHQQDIGFHHSTLPQGDSECITCPGFSLNPVENECAHLGSSSTPRFFDKHFGTYSKPPGYSFGWVSVGICSNKNIWTQLTNDMRLVLPSHKFFRVSIPAHGCDETSLHPASSGLTPKIRNSTSLWFQNWHRKIHAHLTIIQRILIGDIDMVVTEGKCQCLVALKMPIDTRWYLQNHESKSFNNIQNHSFWERTWWHGQVVHQVTQEKF